jgi:FKBP-type peptidyl-prolyl cis-trans isomerase SlyD
MAIGKDQVVSINYTLSEAGGPELEQNEQGIPMAYLHGHNNLLPALEAELEGKNVGDAISVTLAPEQTYGPYMEGASQRVSIKKLVSKHTRLLPGSLVQLQTDHGLVKARVLKVGKFNVDIDLNHPFAGKTLRFDIQVQAVRPATAEEIAHGHAHGEGGHHH